MRKNSKNTAKSSSFFGFLSFANCSGEKISRRLIGESTVERRGKANKLQKRLRHSLARVPFTRVLITANDKLRPLKAAPESKGAREFYLLWKRRDIISFTYALGKLLSASRLASHEVQLAKPRRRKKFGSWVKWFCFGMQFCGLLSFPFALVRRESWNVYREWHLSRVGLKTSILLQCFGCRRSTAQQKVTGKRQTVTFSRV